MDKISKGFVGRTVRAVLFIILIIAFCTAISSAGIYLASRYGLTQSREQVPLTALYLGNEGKVELPGRGKMETEKFQGQLYADIGQCGYRKHSHGKYSHGKRGVLPPGN